MFAQRRFPDHIDFTTKLCLWGDFSGAWVRVWARALRGELSVRSAKVYGNEGLRYCAPPISVDTKYLPLKDFGHTRVPSMMTQA